MKLIVYLHILSAIILTGRVIAIADGDTFTLLTQENKQVKVRLHGIDAPESKQSYGTQARGHLGGMIFRKNVEVEVVDKDQYGRSIGKVKSDGKDINLKMVEDGYAWWYSRFAPDDSALKTAEENARQEKRGLWAAGDGKPPIAPWEFRRKK